MNDQWAAENLQTIRTLMERAALYRRALAPVMTVTGVIGMGAALAGWKAGIDSPPQFILYWLCVAVVTVAAGGVLIRRQALQQAEPFWSPPMRRVSQALWPGLVAGLVLGFLVALAHGRGWSIGLSAPGVSPGYLSQVGLPLIWVILYGCAVHAAGFFMPRGVRLFGWALIVCGCAGFFLPVPQTEVGRVDLGYGLMGVAFGLLHTLYGLYLFATEKPRSNG
ncbi:MAG: hypothetical protein MUE94_04155 [Verrucomicrobia bacterium]|nr:hypothetical protein [Verrucomicrobiota bacterium]